MIVTPIQLTCASLPPCGCADPSRYLDDFGSDDFVPMVCCIAAFIVCMMPPEPLCVLLLLVLPSFSCALASSRSLRFASDLDRGRNTSNIVGRRFGLAVPCTVDWLIITSPSPLFLRSSEFERLPFLWSENERGISWIKNHSYSIIEKREDLLFWFYFF